MENNKYDHYLVLDAARGVAALAVFIYHLKTFVFPDVRGPEFLTLSSSYLAVDLFFLMSGIVLAKAYGEKLVSGYMSFGKFMSVRFFRLYPLYILGMTLGIGYMLVKIAINHEVDLGPSDFIRSMFLNMFFLPDFWNENGIFAFDPAAWSLSLEWLINIIFALLLIKMGQKQLGGVVATSAAVLLYFGIRCGNFDLGWSGSNFIGGVARITFSFTLGIFLYQLMTRKNFLPTKFHWSVSVILLTTLLLALVPPVFLKSIYYDIFLVFVFFPVFCLMVCASAPPPPTCQSIFNFWQNILRPLYIAHTTDPLVYGRVETFHSRRASGYGWYQFSPDYHFGQRIFISCDDLVRRACAKTFR